MSPANLDLPEREDRYGHVPANDPAFRSTLDNLTALPIIELVKDKETFSTAESERVLRGFLSDALFEAGLYCRADDRAEPVVQLSPLLICDQRQCDEMEQILRDTLTRAWKPL